MRRINIIIGYGRGDTTNNGAPGIEINVKAKDQAAPGFHKNIIICGNSHFGISIRNADQVKPLGNEITGFNKKVNFQYSINIDVQ